MENMRGWHPCVPVWQMPCWPVAARNPAFFAIILSNGRETRDVQRFSRPPWVKVVPAEMTGQLSVERFDPLKSKPRFVALMKEMEFSICAPTERWPIASRRPTPGK